MGRYVANFRRYGMITDVRVWLSSQVIPATVTFDTITVTVSAPGVQPHAETFTVTGGAVEVFELPRTVMALGSEQAAKAIHVTSSAMISTYSDVAP